MTDFSAVSLPGHQRSRVAGLPKPPGVVYAAAVVTWVVATGTAALTLLLAVFLLWAVAPVFDAFDAGSGNPRWLVVGTAAVVLVLSAAADVCAVFVLRGRRWAQWVLVGLSMVAAAGGFISVYYIAPLVVTAAAIAVAVLLLLPDADAWFRAPYGPPRVSAHCRNLTAGQLQASPSTTRAHNVQRVHRSRLPIADPADCSTARNLLHPRQEG